jgi:hypothetical protein
MGREKVDFGVPMGKAQSFTGRQQNIPLYVMSSLLTLYLLHGVYAVLEDRFLYADGVDFFVNILESEEVYTNAWRNSRLFADFFTQYPLLFAIKSGVRDIETLGYIFSASLYVPYVIAIVVCLWATRGCREYILFLLIFLFASAMNSEFFMVTESHVAAALFLSLNFLILLRTDWGIGTWLLAICLAIPTLRSYQSMLCFGPMLAAMAAWRGLKSRKLFVRLGWIGFGLWFIAGAGFALTDIIHYPDPTTPSMADFGSHIVSLVRDNMLSVLKGTTHLHYSATLSSIALFFLGSNFSKSEKVARLLPFLMWGFAVGCLAVLVLLIVFPPLMEIHLHYKARTINVLFPIIIVLAMAAMRFKYVLLDEKRWRCSIAIVTTLAIFQCSWHILATQQWAGYLNVFRKEISSRKGFVAFEDSILAKRNIQRQIIAGMNWGWTLPQMSIVLAPEGRVQAIIGNKNPRWSSHPFDPRKAKELPDLSHYGVSYTAYIEVFQLSETSP